MSQDNTQGEIRPNTPTLEIISGVLGVVDSIAVLLDTGLRYPQTTITPEWSATIAEQFRMLADMMENRHE